MSHSWTYLCIYGLGYESLHWKYNTKIGVMRIAIHLTRRWSFLEVKLWVSIFIIALNYNLTTTWCCTFYLVVACHIMYITYNLNVFLTIINCKRYENKAMLNQHVYILTLNECTSFIQLYIFKQILRIIRYINITIMSNFINNYDKNLVT